MVHTFFEKINASKVIVISGQLQLSLEEESIKACRKASSLGTCIKKRARIWFNKLAQFGIILFVTKKYKIKVITTTRVFPSMMVGYDANSAPGDY